MLGAQERRKIEGKEEARKEEKLAAFHAQHLRSPLASGILVI